MVSGLGGQSHVAYTELAKSLDALLAVATAVVGVRTRRLAEERGDLVTMSISQSRSCLSILFRRERPKQNSAKSSWQAKSRSVAGEARTRSAQHERRTAAILKGRQSETRSARHERAGSSPRLLPLGGVPLARWRGGGVPFRIHGVSAPACQRNANARRRACGQEAAVAPPVTGLRVRSVARSSRKRRFLRSGPNSPTSRS
jgi:hypothetical protein